jgi:tRNA dimethylallyltransferase
MDLSRRVVAVSTACGGPLDDGPARTANALEESISGRSNSKPESLPLVVILLGPTGSGKTALSLTLAERFNGEIVSCDSVAVYRGMELGTAKPTREERARAPHHLIDVAEPDEPFTAGAYSRLARELLQKIAVRKHRMPIVTGGTGLYLRALTEGLFAGPERQELLRAKLKSKAQKRGSAWLHRLLTRLDAATAERIHANDTPKLIRAIEVCLATRRPMSQILRGESMGRDPLTGFRFLRIGLNPPRQHLPPREGLYDRLNRRCAEMFAAGLVEETRGLLARFGPVKALDSLGYRQARSVLDGTLSVDEAVRVAQQGHRNYAKRQMTWFRREPEVHWIEGFGDEADSQLQAFRLLQSAASFRVNE